MRLVPVGRVIADHGLGGAVKFKYYNEKVEQFYCYTSLILDRDGRQTELKPTEVRFSKGYFYLKFAGLSSPEKVSFLINQELCVKEENLPPLGNDEYYDYQLIGLDVANRARETVGTVSDVIHMGEYDIIVVHGAKELMVPLVEGLIVSIDLNSATIIIDEDAITV